MLLPSTSSPNNLLSLGIIFDSHTELCNNDLKRQFFFPPTQKKSGGLQFRTYTYDASTKSFRNPAPFSSTLCQSYTVALVRKMPARAPVIIAV